MTEAISRWLALFIAFGALSLFGLQGSGELLGPLWLVSMTVTMALLFLFRRHLP
jgi:hypothetical protein